MTNLTKVALAIVISLVLTLVLIFIDIRFFNGVISSQSKFEGDFTPNIFFGRSKIKLSGFIVIFLTVFILVFIALNYAEKNRPIVVKSLSGHYKSKEYVFDPTNNLGTDYTGSVDLQQDENNNIIFLNGMSRILDEVSTNVQNHTITWASEGAFKRDANRLSFRYMSTSNNMR